jgi:hypothetical protein
MLSDQADEQQQGWLRQTGLTSHAENGMNIP